MAKPKRRKPAATQRVAAGLSTAAHDPRHSEARVRPNTLCSLLLAIVCAALATALYWNTLGHAWAFDDMRSVTANRDVYAWKNLSHTFKHDFWGNDINQDDINSHRSFRPFTVASFHLDYLRAGSSMTASVFHQTNVALNAVVCTLVVWAALLTLDMQSSVETTVMGQNAGVLACALLYTAHPIHTEAVANVTGRAEVLSALCCVLAHCVYVRFCLHRNRVVPVVIVGALAFFAALCKEPGITVVLVCAGHDFAINILPLCCNRTQAEPERVQTVTDDTSSAVASVSEAIDSGTPGADIGGTGAATARAATANERDSRAAPPATGDSSCGVLCAVVRIVLLAAVAVAYLYFRYTVTGGHVDLVPMHDFNPIGLAPTPVRVASGAWVTVYYFWLLVFPSTMACDYSFNSIPLVESPTDPRLLLIALFLCALIACFVVGVRDAVGKRDAALLVSLGWFVAPLLPAMHIVGIGTVLAERLLYLPSLGFTLLMGSLLNRALAARSRSRERDRGKKKDTQVAKRPAAWLVLPVLVLVVALYTKRTTVRNEDWYDNITLMQHDAKVQPNSVKLLDFVTGQLIQEKDFAQAHTLAERARVIRASKGRASKENLATLARILANHDNKQRDRMSAHRFADAALAIPQTDMQSRLEHKEAIFAKGFVHYEFDEFESAAHWLEKTVRDTPTHEQANCFLGVAYCRMQKPKYKEAVRPLQQCITLFKISMGRHRDQNRRLADHYINLAQAMLLSNHPGAEKAYKEGLRLNPQSPRREHVLEDLKYLQRKKQKK